MKKLTAFLFILAAVLCTFIISGCDEDVTNPTNAQVTQINANGSLAATSSTQASGTLVIADQNNNPVTGLTSQNVTVNLVWGNMAQTGSSVTCTVLIQSLSQSGKNIAVATTMDYSGSMETGGWNSTASKYQQILDMENGVKTFVNALAANDICEIIKFDSYVEVFQTFTNSKQALINAVDSVGWFGGSTALYQSIYTGVQDVAAQSASSYARAVIAFTDGGENASSVDFETMIRTANANAIPVYTIGLFDSTYHSTPPGYYSDERTLVQIADSTGGFYFYAPNASELVQIYNSISGQLTNAYTITITWPTTTLPASGTLVTAFITVNYNGLISQFQRDFIMP